MILLKTQTPSGGFNTDVDKIELKPLTYGELMRYLSTTQVHDTVGEMVYDIENLLMHRVDHWELICAYDANFIISMIKMLSCTNDNKFTDSLGNEYSVEDIFFTPMDERIGKIYEVGNWSFHIPKMGEYYNSLKNMASGNKLAPATVAACLGIGLDQLSAAPIEMTADIEFLKKNIMTQPYVEKGGERTTIFLGNASQIFRSFIENNRYAFKYIKYKEDIQS